MTDFCPVSVIMGAYNCENTITTSIESILTQDWKNLEFVICDDGSCDRTPQIIREYVKKDNRIKFIENEKNLGLAKTLNKCASHAKGDYLVRMDGDDISLPGRISRQIHFLESHTEYAFCGCSINLFDETGIWGKLEYPEIPDSKSFLLRSPYAHPAVVIRKTAFILAEGYDENPAIGRSEDYDLFMRMHAMGLCGYNLRERLFSYREEYRSFKKRKYRYTLTEARVRMRGFYKLGLFPTGLVFVLKPLLIGLLPKSIYSRMRKVFFG